MTKEIPNEHIRSMRNLGPLHDLLLKACPPDENGVKSIPILAEAISMTSFGVYKWIKNVKIPADKAVRVVEISGGRVVLEEFHPYVYA